MWWNYQNLDSARKDKDGSLWHFRIWHDHIQGIYTQRIFFWDETRRITACLELSDDQTLDTSRLKQRINKIMTNSGYRQKFLKELNFPIEKHYS
jgi:hypothetical protein